MISGCKARDSVSIPSFGESSQIAGAPRPPGLALAALEGIYDAKMAPFGDTVSVHATRHTLSIFSDKLDAYTVLYPGCLQAGSRLVFEGYWRHASTVDTGLVRLEADALSARAICAGLPLAQPAELTGATGSASAAPSDAASAHFAHPLASMKSFAVAAHHGACRTIDSCGASENSLASIALVEPFGATTVELDVRLTSDGVPILFHDDSWSPRLVEGPLCHGGVEQLSLAAVRANCRLVFGEAIPTLDEALAFIVDDTEIRVVWLDVKVADAVAATSAVIRKFDAVARQKARSVRFIVGLADADIVAAFVALPRPRVPCLIELELQQVIDVGCEVWGPRWTRGTMASEVATAKAQGIFTAFWTIDEVDFLDRFLLEARPNAILTNRAGLLFHRYQMLAPRLQGAP